MAFCPCGVAVGDRGSVALVLQASGLLTKKIKLKKKKKALNSNFRTTVHLKDNKYKRAASGTSLSIKSRRSLFYLNFILSHSTHLNEHSLISFSFNGKQRSNGLYLSGN